MRTAAAVAILCLTTACTTPEPINSTMGPTEYLCAEHGTHRFDVIEEKCACLKIDPKEYGDYAIFTITGETDKEENVPELLDRLRDEMENRIVAKVLRRIEKAMGKSITKHWNFDQMDIPVTIRGFRKRDAGTIHVLIAAAMTKYSLSPRGIIMYLPLEYKMHILEKKKGE